MTAQAVAVTGLGLWMAGFPSASAWAAGRIDPEAERPKGLAFDRVNRRRAGVLGRAIADASAEALEQADVEAGAVPTVIGSAIGEAATMIGLLEQMWRTKEPMSPAAFAISVHNASSGLLSISAKNRGYATSIAADEDTPAAALLEGIGLVHHFDAPVLIACGDEATPRSLARDEPLWDLLAAALVLAPVDRAPRSRAGLSIVSAGESDLAPAELEDAPALNPQAGLVDLVDAIQRGRPGQLRLDRGLGRGTMARLTFDPAP